MNTALFTITQPARDIVACLPRGARQLPKIEQPVQPVTIFKAGEPVALHSVRTYYLGINGRVSQRKHLVGELLATVRAHSTDQARYLFTQAGVSKTKPFIGEAEGQKADRLTRKHTAFTSFMDMATNTHPTYRPSMDMRDPELVWLADYYDRMAEARGDSRRVYRYGTEKEA